MVVGVFFGNFDRSVCRAVAYDDELNFANRAALLDLRSGIKAALDRLADRLFFVKGGNDNR